MTVEESPCDRCIAEALLVVSTVRDDLHHVLWAERPLLCGIDRAIHDLFAARAMLRATGGEQ